MSDVRPEPALVRAAGWATRPIVPQLCRHAQQFCLMLYRVGSVGRNGGLGCRCSAAVGAVPLGFGEFSGDFGVVLRVAGGNLSGDDLLAAPGQDASGDHRVNLCRKPAFGLFVGELAGDTFGETPDGLGAQLPEGLVVGGDLGDGGQQWRSVAVVGELGLVEGYEAVEASIGCVWSPVVSHGVELVFEGADESEQDVGLVLEAEVEGGAGYACFVGDALYAELGEA